MTALTDYIPDVISYLLAQAASNAALAGATPPVTVIDGQPATQDVLAVNGTGLTQRLWVGSSGWVTSGQVDSAAMSQQGFAFIDNARTRDEDLDIAMAAEAISGDSVMSEARAGAFAVMAAIELLLRGYPGTTPASPGDATMGGLVHWSEVTGPIELMQEQSSQGAIALVKFRVTAYMRLTS